MASVAYSVALLLQQNSFGTLGADIFVYKWGLTEGHQILVMNTGGNASELKTLYRNPYFQILVRGEENKSREIYYEEAENIYNFLVSSPENITVDGYAYKGFEPTTDIMAIGEDENGRPIFSMNFETYI
jgi:hypothetical protein